MKILEGLKSQEMLHHDMQIGCIKGCLDFLGIRMSDAWLTGGSGHAFVLCADEVLCPSCPSCTYGNCPPSYHHMFAKLGRNLGYDSEYVMAFAGDPEVETRKREAWDVVRAAIDEGRPCFRGCGKLLVGHDSVGYYIGNEARGPVPWADGDYVLACALSPCPPADDVTTVKDALNFALEYAQLGGDHGLAAYDNWARAVQTARINCDHGGQCVARHWLRCRELAVEFLEEAKSRIGAPDTAPLLDAARDRYQDVCENLQPVAHRFRLETIGEHQRQLADEAVRDEVVGQLKAAKAAESMALKVLEKIVAAL